jgi:hypothetical protein
MRNGMGFVDHLQRSYADRAARTMNQFHSLGEQVIDSILDDGVGLPAAHLHQHPWARLNTAHLADNLLGYVTVTVFIQVFHCR